MSEFPYLTGGSSSTKKATDPFERDLEQDPELGFLSGAASRKARVEGNIKMLTGSTPDQEAANLSMSNSLKVPVSAIREDPTMAKRYQEAKDTVNSIENYPNVLDYLADVENAAISRDDAVELSDVTDSINAQYGDVVDSKTLDFIDAFVAKNKDAETVQEGPEETEGAGGTPLEGIVRTGKTLEASSKRMVKMALGSIDAIAGYYENLDQEILESMPADARQKVLEDRAKWSPLAKRMAFTSKDFQATSKWVKEVIENENLIEPGILRREGIAGYYDDVIGMAPQVLAQMGTFMATGGLGSVAFMGSQISGGKFLELTEKGVSRKRAAQAGFADAILQAPLEQIGLGKAMRAWKPGAISAKARDILEAMGTEFLTEVLQAYPDAATTIWGEAQLRSQKPQEQVDTFINQWADITAKGLYEGSVAMIFGGAPTAIKIGIDAATGKAATETFQESQADINEKVNATKTKERSSKHIEEFIKSVGGTQDIYMSAEGVKTLFQEDIEGAKFLMSQLGTNPETALQNAEAGTDLMINQAEMHARITPEQFSQIQNDLKPAPSALTQKESDEVDVESGIEQAQRTATEQQQYQKDLNREKTRVRNEIIQAGHTPDYADSLTALYDRFQHTRSDQLDFFKRIKFQRVAADTITTEGETLFQSTLSDFPETNRLTNIDKASVTWETIKSNNPIISDESENITIYRATVGDEVRPGDFVAINKDVAEQHLDNLKDRGEEGQLVIKDVKVKNLIMGADATEFVYSPGKIVVPEKAPDPRILFQEGPDLVQIEAFAEESNTNFETGKPVSFNFLRNTEPSPKHIKGTEDTFQQSIEPAGKYMVFNSTETKPLPGWEAGEVTFMNPLVVRLNTKPSGRIYDENSWKANLVKTFGSKGAALSQDLVDFGYDGIVTIDIKGNTAEIVDLGSFEPKNMIVQHNLTAENVSFANKVGGLAVPSLAIAYKNAPLTGFGEVSLIGSSDLVDPTKDKSVKVYNADIYSPRYPGVTFKLDDRAVNKLRDTIEPFAAEIGEGSRYSFLQDSEMETRGLNAVSETVSVKYAFLKSIKKAPKILSKVKPKLPRYLKKFKGGRFEMADNPKFREAANKYYTEKVDAVMDRIIAKADEQQSEEQQQEVREDLESTYFGGNGEVIIRMLDQLAFQVEKANSPKEPDFQGLSLILSSKISKNLEAYEQWVFDNFSGIIEGERIFNGHTHSGHKKYLPHDLDTVVKLMKRKLRDGEDHNYGVGSIRATAAKQFKSIKQIKADRNQLVSEEKFQVLKDEVNDEFSDLANKLKPFYKFESEAFGYLDEVSQAFKEFSTRGVYGLDEFFDPLDDSTLEEIRTFMQKLRNMPTEYFEAKLQRSVDLSEFSGAVVPKGKKFAETIKTLRDNGITNIKRYPEKDKDARAKAIGSFKRQLFQTGTTKKAAIQINDQQFLISLFENADLSSAIHETGHLFFTEMSSVIEAGDADPALAKDLQLLRDWVGVKEGEALQTKHEEMIADGFLKYISEGKAPSVELVNAFERFKNWLMKIYEWATQADISISDEVRGVFDRMFTARHEVFNAASESHMSPMTKAELDALGVSPADRIYLNQLLKQTYEKAEKELFWDRNRNRKTLEKTWTEEAKQEVSTDPVYVAINSAKSGQGLDRAWVQEIIGAESIKIIQKKHGKSVVKENGQNPDELASLSGFQTGTDMVWAMFKANKLSDQVEAIVNKKGEVYDTQFKAEDYIVGIPEYGEFLTVKGKYEAKGLTETTSKKALKVFAKRQLDKMSVSEAIKPSTYLTAVSKYSRIESNKNRSRDFKAASDANEKVRLNYEMAAQATKNSKKVNQILKRAKKAVRSKTIDMQYQENIRALGTRFELISKNQGVIRPDQKEPLANLLTDADSLIDASGAFSPFLVSESFAKNYKEIPMEEMEELGFLLKYLEGRGRDIKNAVLKDGKTTVEEAAELSASETSDIPPKKLKKRFSYARKLSDNINKYFSMRDGLQFIAISLGGYKNIGKDGVKSETEKLILDPLIDAQNEESKMFININNELNPHMFQILTAIKRLRTEHGKHIFIDGAPAPVLLRVEGQEGWWTPEQIFSIALNMGNQGNIDRIHAGYKDLSESSVAVLMDLLEEKDWQAIQGIWDTYEKLRPEVEKVHNRVNHFPMGKIDPKPVVTKFGTFKGGYHPAIYDNTLLGVESLKVAEWQEKDDLLSRSEAIRQVPSNKSGFTKGRKNGVELPISLRLSVVTDHIKDSVHYITHNEAIRDVDRITRHPVFVDQAQSILGRDTYNMIRPALKFIARPERQATNWLDRSVEWMRGKTTPFILAWNTSVALKQGFSSFSAAYDMGVKDYLKGFGHILSGSPIRKHRDMMEMSVYMSQRATSMDRELQSMFRSMKPDQRFLLFGDKKVTWDDVRNFGFWPIRIADMMTVLPIWYGAYNKKLNETQDAEVAISYADNIVRKTQPSAQPLDLVEWQRASGVTRLFSFFQTFTVGKYAQRQALHYRAWKAGKLSTKEYGWFNFCDAILPAIGMNTLFAFLHGKDLGDEETWEGMGPNIIGYLALTGLPIVGALFSGFGGAFDSPAAIGVDELQRTIKASGNFIEKQDDKTIEALTWRIFSLMSYLTGVPASRVLEKVAKGAEQKEENLPGIKYLVPAPRK